MSKKIFITGAAGFIGFHLAKTLALRSDQVLGLDNFNDYYSVDLKKARANELASLGVPVVFGDITDFETLREKVERHQTSHLVHLAAQAGVRYSVTHPHAYIKANIEGFLNVLEVCRNTPSIKLTYASSSSVYGLNTKVPFAVSDPTDAQASLYGVTKKSNELMARAYHHLYNISATGLRFFTVYGPFGRPDMAYFSFTKSILEGKPITLYNFGKMERDFTYIDDIIQGTIAAIDLESPFEIFNLGGCKPVDIQQMVHVLEKLLGKKAVIAKAPMQAGDVFRTYADIGESQKTLLFTPQTEIAEGLEHFVDWYLKFYG